MNAVMNFHTSATLKIERFLGHINKDKSGSRHFGEEKNLLPLLG